jgi:ubiquinone/menaquinone biosynthesis C-methylase UbiE
MNDLEPLTERQRNELEYHREHAKQHSALLEQPVNFDIVLNNNRRWWNAHWEMYTYLRNKNLKEQNVLVVGCGFGDDALYLARHGAHVKAFDLSPESLSIARARAEKESLAIEFKEMPAEKLEYKNNYFDLVVARDILHHVDISKSINEILRVSRPGAIFCFNEVYSHSITNRIRYSNFVDKWLYPKMASFVYGGKKPYITADERKLNEQDIKIITASMAKPEIEKYFNLLIGRLIPDNYLFLVKLDRVLLYLLSPIAKFLGARILIAGRLNTAKQHRHQRT